MLSSNSASKAANGACKIKHFLLAIVLVIVLYFLMKKQSSGVYLDDTRNDPLPGSFGLSEYEITPTKDVARQRYASRRWAIKEFCSKHMDWGILREISLDIPRWRRYMWHSTQYKFSWCGIAKVGSTTWTQHMIKLTGLEWEELIEHLDELGIPRQERRNHMKANYYALPMSTSLIQATNREHFTFTYVRHPFSRFVSGYTQKMDLDWPNDPNREFIWMRDLVLTRYRGINESDPDWEIAIPTPVEFLNYVLDEADKLGKEHLDPHFKPQYASCPHCLVDFDVVARTETFTEDTDFIINALKLTGILETELHANNQADEKHTDPETREREFFSKVPKSMIKKLYDLYEVDFLMFDYGGYDSYYLMGMEG